MTKRRESGPPIVGEYLEDWEGLLTSTWGRQPFYRRGESGRFAGLATLDELDDLLTSGLLLGQMVRLVSSGRPVPSSSYVHQEKLAYLSTPDVVDNHAMLLHFAQGATIVLECVDRYVSSVAYFCRDMEHATGSPVDATLLVTPAGAQGFVPHWDKEDVLVLQLAGSKVWQVWEPEAPDAIADGIVPSPTAATALNVTLQDGDLLYIPRGWIHAAKTTNELSAHISVITNTKTLADVYDSVFSTARELASMRGRAPVSVSEPDEDLLAEIERARGDVVAHVLAADPKELASEFRHSRQEKRVLLKGQLLDLGRIGQASGDVVFVPRAENAVTLTRRDGDQVYELRVGQRRMTATQAAATVLGWLRAEGEIRLAALAERKLPGGDSPLAALRFLVVAGAVRIKPVGEVG